MSLRSATAGFPMAENRRNPRPNPRRQAIPRLGPVLFRDVPLPAQEPSPLPVIAPAPIGPVPFLPGISFTSLHFRHMPLIKLIIPGFGYMSITNFIFLLLSEIDSVIFREGMTAGKAVTPKIWTGHDCHEFQLHGHRPVFSIKRKHNFPR